MAKPSQEIVELARQSARLTLAACGHRRRRFTADPEEGSNPTSRPIRGHVARETVQSQVQDYFTARRRMEYLPC